MTSSVLTSDLTELLDRIVTDLRGAAGPALRGVALYGGLAKGRYTPGISDINLVVVVTGREFALLTSLAGVLTPARRRHRVATLVVTPQDLVQLGRLFPVKLHDMQAAHRVLFGEPGLNDVRLDPAAFTLRLEQELRNLELRFRQTVVDRGAEPGVLWRRLLAGLPRLAVVLEAVLRRRDQEVPVRRADVLRGAAASLGTPAGQIEPFALLHREDPVPGDARVLELAAGYLTLLGGLADGLEAAVP